MQKRTKLLALAAIMALVVSAMMATPAMAEAAKAEVMPPLTGDGAGQTYAQAVWAIVIFLILLAILYPTAWKNVLAGLKKREERIRADLASAEGARLKAETSLVEYNKQILTAESTVRELLSKAAVEAEAISSGIRTRAQQEAEEIKEKAMKEIESTKRQALTEIYEQTAELATSVAEKILRRNLNANDQRDLVNESLGQLQSVHA